MKKIFFSLSLSLLFLSLYSFDTLEELKRYIEAYPEYPVEEGLNWLDPDYTAFHTSIQPRWWNSLLHWTKVAKKPHLPREKFIALLKELGTKREKEVSGNFISKICLSDTMKCIVIGDLQGELHSFYRILSDLRQQEIIDNNFKIISPSSYIIFNGDTLSRSAYTLETFLLLLVLLKKNPERIVWVRGSHEDHEVWYNFGLRRELQLRLKGLSKERVPFNNEVMKFFSTLPLGLYIQNSGDLSHVVRIGTPGMVKRVDEELLGDFFADCTVGTLRSYKLNKQEKTHPAVEIVAFIGNESWYRITNLDEGLYLLESDKGITNWAILSSPVSMYKLYYDFFYDAYAIITMGTTMARSTITLRNQDVRFTTGFSSKITYYISSGIEEEYGTQKPDIVVGSTLALTKGVFVMGRRVRRGMFVRFNKENQQGGINGQRLRLVIYDDQYKPRKVRSNIEALLKDNINMILLPVGSPTLQSYLDLVKNNTVAVFFPVTGGPQFRKSDIKGIAHWRSSYTHETESLMKYVTQFEQATKFAFFYQNDAYGLGPLEIAHKFLKEHGITSWTDVSYIRMDIDLKAEAEKINLDQPEAVGLFSAANPTRNLLRHLGAESLITKTLFGISFLAEESFRNYLREIGLDILFSQIVPNPETSTLPIVREYREEMDKYNYPYDVFSLEAYISASLLIEFMKQIEGPITKESVMKVIESTKNMSYKGLQLTFDPEIRSLAHYVWLETNEKAEWIEFSI